MKKAKLIPVLTILSIISSFVFLINIYNFAHAESLTDKIKESMKETEDRKQQIDQFMTEINQKFEKGGYRVGISVSGEDFPFGLLNVNITVHDKRYKKDHEKQIKTLTEKVLDHYELDNVAINIEVQDNRFAERSEEDKRLEEQFDEIFTIAEKVLAEKNYYIASMSIRSRSSQPNIEIEIANNKELVENDKNKLEKHIRDQIYSKYKIDYIVTITEKTEEEIKEEKWHPIFTSIAEEVNKHFEEFTGFAYSFHPKPLQIIIKTSIRKGQQGFEGIAKEIETYVHEVIKIKREELSLEEEPYQIIIKSKEQKKLN